LSSKTKFTINSRYFISSILNLKESQTDLEDKRKHNGIKCTYHWIDGSSSYMHEDMKIRPFGSPVCGKVHLLSALP
jgi:hypothetical protein